MLLALTLSVGGGVASKGNDQAATYENLRLFTEVLSIVQSQYVDEVAAKDIIYSAIKGTLRGLDPHSSFLDAEMYREMQVETSGVFGGLGIEITLRDDVLTVVSPIDGTPAYRVGIQSGDRIVKIEGLSTKDMQLTDAVKRMRGKPGTKIIISIMREGFPEPKDFEITREQIHVQSVRAVPLEAGIEYIRLRQFQEQTAQDMEAALDKFTKNDKIQGLVLDLRNNPGGLLTSAVEVSERFIEAGKLVVDTEGRVRNQNMRFQANAKRVYSDFPIVELVNQGSASASEIVAGALQDHGRAVVLGTQTFGKGRCRRSSRCQTAPVSGSPRPYFTPKGRSIQGKGLTPDIIVEVPKVTGPQPCRAAGAGQALWPERGHEAAGRSQARSAAAAGAGPAQGDADPRLDASDSRGDAGAGPLASGAAGMPAGVWKALAGVIVALLLAVIALDQWQARQGEPSLLGFSLFTAAPATQGAPRASGSAKAPRPLQPTLSPAPPPTANTSRLAVIVDGLGSRRDVFDLLKDLGRPVAVAILPDLPLSPWIAGEAARLGMEVLLDLPMEPYRYPELTQARAPS